MIIYETHNICMCVLQYIYEMYNMYVCILKNKKHFLNEQRSRDAAAKKELIQVE